MSRLKLTLNQTFVQKYYAFTLQVTEKRIYKPGLQKP